MLAGVVFLMAAAQTAGPLSDPYQIFERAREVWSAQRYSDVVDYTVHVSAAKGATREDRHYHVFWMPGSNEVAVQPPVSDEQLAHPYKPSAGVNFMNVWNIGGPRKGTGVQGDLFGVPSLAPNYSFGISTYVPSQPTSEDSSQIVADIRREYHDPAPQKVAQVAAKSGLKTIALVNSTAHAYRITLVGLESEPAGEAYHLALFPLRDPNKYRLRDMWVDARTFDTDKLRAGANFMDSATESVPWTVDFETVDGLTHIVDERAEKPISGYHGLIYDSFEVTFENYSSGKMPYWGALNPVDSVLREP